MIEIDRVSEWVSERKKKKKKKKKRKRNEMIKWIWTDNKFGDEGARMISEALKSNSTLTTLDLSCDENWSKWSDCKTW